ncbi:hypothetical protein N8387_00675 [Polaribacter sp.]|nr:hypothetical protein [Polaribacter sp.]
MKLTETHIQELYKFTRKHFVEHYDVQTELVDHLALQEPMFQPMILKIFGKNTLNYHSKTPKINPLKSSAFLVLWMWLKRNNLK